MTDKYGSNEDVYFDVFNEPNMYNKRSRAVVEAERTVGVYRSLDVVTDACYRDRMELPFTCSGGGPIVLLPLELLPLWRGTTPPDGVEVPPGWSWGSKCDFKCDYDRACDSPEEHQYTPYGGLGWISVGDGIALIFDSEITTYWLPNEAGGAVIRGSAGSDDDNGEMTENAAKRVLADAEACEWTTLDKRLVVQEPQVVLFDSAYPGAKHPDDINSADPVLVGDLPPGIYSIALATTKYETDVIRLQRVKE